MRKIISALQVSLDGYIEGPNGELDWVESWEDPFDFVGNVDAFILGARMYPGYEEYWQTVSDNPRGVLQLTGRPATEGEIAYAAFAKKTPHIVLSNTLRTVSWKNTRIVRSLNDIWRLKEAPGGAVHAVGGASLVSSLINAGLVDELRLIVHPILLGGGKAVFEGLSSRCRLSLTGVLTLDGGKVELRYVTSIPEDLDEIHTSRS